MRAASVALLLIASSFAGLAGADHPQASGSKTVVFDSRGGNEWWVEVKLSGASAGQVTSVQARDDGGSWKSLTKRSWGPWAASFHIEPGHKVTFRATFSDGTTLESCPFSHPDGIERCGGGTTPGAFSFDHRAGSEWWIEVRVAPKPVAVQAMDTGGAWKALTLRSWGNWAGSFRIESGHDVRFRAQAANGTWTESCWFSHPAGVEKCESASSWPREGSFVKYVAGESESVPGYADWTDVNVTYTYRNGAWSLDCEGWHYTEIDGEMTDQDRILTTSAAAPPINPTAVRLGEEADVRGVPCVWSGARGRISGPVVADTWRDRAPARATAYYVTFHPEWPQYTSGGWDARTGLTLGWGDARSHSGNWGELIDTDAPIEPLGSRTSWPFEGSYAKYRTSDEHGSQATITYTFVNGGWEALCEMSSGSYAFTLAPVFGPTTARSGDDGYYLFNDGCGLRSIPLEVRGKFPEDATRDGAPHRATAWWADEPDGHDDADAWWDVKTGLMTRWESAYYDGIKGRLVDTDAPLSSG